MKKTLLGILAVLTYTFTFGQSFEGKLTFKVDFDIKTQKIGDFEITKDKVIEKMKKDGEYFDTVIVTLKDGNYIKEDNSSSEKKVIYKSDLNKIYTLQKDFEYVVITDANKRNAMDLGLGEPKIEKIDSLKVINGINCKLLKLTWKGIGQEFLYYNSENVKIDSDLFINHKFEYFNDILKVTNSYPLEINRVINNFTSIKMTLVSISKEEIEDSIFELPKFKKAEKDYAEMMLNMTGSEVMKIKN